MLAKENKEIIFSTLKLKSCFHAIFQVIVLTEKYLLSRVVVEPFLHLTLNLLGSKCP